MDSNVLTPVSWRSGGRHSTENVVSPAELYKLLEQPKLELIKWLQNHNMLAKYYICPTCEDHFMTIGTTSTTSDGYRWHCAKTNCTRSIRRGTWFEHSRLTIQEILILTYHFSHKSSQESTRIALKAKNHASVVDWYNYCREVCLDTLIDKTSDTKIGGLEVIVEVLFGRRKFCRAKNKQTNKPKWLLAGIERGTCEYFITEIENRDKTTLERVVSKHILPGTQIYTSFKETYHDFVNVAHLDYFVSFFQHALDPATGQKSKKIEGSWSWVRRSIPPAGHRQDTVISYFAEFMYRKTIPSTEDPFIRFLSAISQIYIPLLHDPGGIESICIRDPSTTTESSTSHTVNIKIEKVLEESNDDIYNDIGHTYTLTREVEKEITCSRDTNKCKKLKVEDCISDHTYNKLECEVPKNTLSILEIAWITSDVVDD